jgi:hypothetical protein
MVLEKGRYVGIDLSKRTWEMAIISRSGKLRTNEQGDMEPEEKTARYSRTTAEEGRVRVLNPTDKEDALKLAQLVTDCLDNRLHALFVHAGITTVVKRALALATDEGRR